MDIAVIFGKNVRKYRMMLGLSQEQLAEKCGLHRTYISSIERSRRNVSLQSVRKIADALEIEAYQLLTEEENDDIWIDLLFSKTLLFHK